MSDYRLTFAVDADGGPAHVLYLLKEYVVDFRKDGQPIDPTVEAWLVHDVDVNNDLVIVIPWEDATSTGGDGFTGPTRTFNISTDFDEVVYQ